MLTSAIKMEKNLSQQITRAYADHTGKRTTLRFDASTWSAIDYCAAANGTGWDTWINHVPVASESRTNDVRRQVMETLMLITKGERAAGSGRQVTTEAGWLATGNAMLMQSIPMDDAQLKADFASGNPYVHLSAGTHNFHGFQVRTGHRNGKPCYWIINGLRGGTHLAIPAKPVYEVADADDLSNANGERP